MCEISTWNDSLTKITEMKSYTYILIYLQNCINKLLALPLEDCKLSTYLTCITCIYLYIHIYNIYYKDYTLYIPNKTRGINLYST